MTPYYDADGVTIYHGDCVDVLPSVRNVGLVVTSPPYNLSENMTAGSLAASALAGGYDGYSDSMPQEEYNRWQRLVLFLLWRALADNGAIAYNHKPRVQAGVALLPTDYGTGLPLRQVIVWDRGTGLNFSDHFFLPKCEWVCIWAKPGWRLRDRACCQVGDVWRFGPEQDPAHPAPFPVALPARLIEATRPGLVVDPFMGSGTTLVAAKAAGRCAIGIERSERYCEIAARRLAQGVLFGAPA